MDDEVTAGSLQEWIAAVSFVDKDADGVTEFLVEAVTWWAQGAGWRAYRKARSVFPLPPPFAHRHSYVDVGIARPGLPPIVVEIDRSDRKRTVDKLVAEAAAGRLAFWLRWGTGPFTTIPPETVRLIRCPVVARRTSDGHKLFSSPPRTPPPPRHSGLDLSDAEQSELFD